MSDEAVYIKLLKTGNNIGTFKVTADNYTTPTVSLISPNDTIPGYEVSKTSFVVGSTQLDDTTNPDNDIRMLFDKTNGAFRAGTAASNQWDSVNRGTNSTALGNNNIASGINSFAVGSSNTASGTSISNDTTVAIGDNNIASGLNAIAIGERNISSGSKSFTFGTANNVTGSFSIAIGNGILDGNPDNNNNVYGTQSIAIGTTNTIGDPVDGTKNSTDGSIVIGTSNILTSHTSGTPITGTSQNSFILGSNCTVTSADNATAIGQYCTATGANSVAIGQYCTAAGANSFAIGYGTSSTKNTAGVEEKNGSVSIGYQNTSTGTNSFAIGNNNTSTGENSVAIGYGTSGTKNNAGNTGSVSIGYQNNVSGIQAVAIGSNNIVGGDYSFAIGNGCNTQHSIGAICMGYKAVIDTSYDTMTYGDYSQYTFFWNGDTSEGDKIYASAPGSVCFRLGNDVGVYGVDTNFRRSEFRIQVSSASIDLSNPPAYPRATWLDSSGPGWINDSDINLKENLIEHDYSDTLAKIMEMPIYTYNFKGSDPINKCFGPVAQDFNRLFVTNCNPLGISSSNLASITLSGVKGVKLGLDSLSDNVNTRFASNSDATSALQSRIDVLEASLNTVSAQVVSLLATLEST